MIHNSAYPEGTDRHEPDGHHRSEEPAHPCRSQPLNQEQAEQDDRGDRYNEISQRRGSDLHSFDRRQHRGRRRAGRPRLINVIRAMMPPSPLLSARMTSSTYVIVTMIVTDQKISDMTP